MRNRFKEFDVVRMQRATAARYSSREIRNAYVAAIRGNDVRCVRGFTLAEIMISMMIFAMVAAAGTYMMSAASSAQNFFRNGTGSQSEVEFALGRMVENVRAAAPGGISSPTSTTAASTLKLTTLTGATVTYTVSNFCLTEQLNSGTANVLVHGTSAYPVSFSVAQTQGNAKAFAITISAGSSQNITRNSITAFGRNL